MTKKQIIILVIMVIVIIVGGVFGYLNLKSDEKPKGSLNKVEVLSKSDYSSYDGYWYESKEDVSLNYIKLSNIKDNTFDMTLSFYGLHSFANITLELEDGVGTIDVSEDDESLKGTLSFYDNELVFYISESTFEGIDLGSTYTYRYHTEEEATSLDPVEEVDGGYKGVWYLGMKGDFETSLVISSISANQVGMRLNFPTHAFGDNKVTIKDGKGTFEIKDSTGSIQGEMELGDNEVIVRITTSSISDISVSSYTFDFKAKTVTFKDYIGQWYLDENKDEKNLLEIRDYSRNTIIFDMLIDQYANLKNVAVDMKNNYGSFECKSSADERELDGNLVLDDDRIYIVITKSTVSGVETGTVYEYMYRGGEENAEES